MLKDVIKNICKKYKEVSLSSDIIQSLYLSMYLDLKDKYPNRFVRNDQRRNNSISKD
jgi:hypothetical protein